MRSIFTAFLAVIAFAAPLSVSAQTTPPSYAQSAIGGDAQIHGRIVSFDGAYSLRVRDEKGYIDNVQLHQGTIINPTGLTLAPGMVISILGYNAGSYFAANEVDTPYTFYAGVPYYAGHPWFYYGPSVSLDFFFAHPGWWHGAGFLGPFHYYGGVRVYDNVHNDVFFHGGGFHGRDYIEPRARGGYVVRGHEIHR